MYNLRAFRHHNLAQSQQSLWIGKRRRMLTLNAHTLVNLKLWQALMPEGRQRDIMTTLSQSHAKIMHMTFLSTNGWEVELS
jgi:hypothetical protein